MQLDGDQILVKLGRLPMESWEYIDSDERHIFPCTEDFYEQFDLGIVRNDGTRDHKHLLTADVAGVALVGVQALYQQLKLKDKKIKDLETRLALLEKQVAELTNR
jgi:hypothetical protein